jgi:hypothetical protein
MKKFGRTYRITIDPGDGGGLIVITLPFTVQFWLQRNNYASLNYLSLDVYNLSENVRNRIFQDRFYTRKKKVVFEAGYGVLSLIFAGDIFFANSSRDGVNIITRIEGRSGIYDTTTTQVFTSIAEGKTLGDLFTSLIGLFPNLSLGAVGDYPEVFDRAIVLNGNVYDIIKTYSNNQVSVDMDRVYVLKPNEVLDDPIFLIDDSTGILETPRRDEGFLSVTTLFEPAINMNSRVKLASSILRIYNGTYKVVGILHQGTISPSVAGTCRTTVSLFISDQLFGKLLEVRQQAP